MACVKLGRTGDEFMLKLLFYAWLEDYKESRKARRSGREGGREGGGRGEGGRERERGRGRVTMSFQWRLNRQGSCMQMS